LFLLADANTSRTMHPTKSAGHGTAAHERDRRACIRGVQGLVG
jgi:hypothetical protein